MRNIFFAAIFAVLAIGSAAQAEEPFDQEAFIAARNAEKKTTVSSIVNLRNAYPAFCEGATKGVVADNLACVAFYKVLVASAEKEAAWIEAEIAAAKTSPENRAALLKILPPKEFNGEGKLTTQRSAEIGGFFLKLKAGRTTTGNKN